jgi:hypothetical protein
MVSMRDGVRSNPKYGDIDFGDQMKIHLRDLHLRWFDYHLKGVQMGLIKKHLFGFLS